MKKFLLMILVLGTIGFSQTGCRQKGTVSPAEEQRKAEVLSATPEVVVREESPEAPAGEDQGEMIEIPGGKIRIGYDGELPNTQPVFEAEVATFFMDKHLVTVGQFRKFIKATKFVTEAEKFGDAGVFNMKIQNWELLKGATWEYPLGKGEAPAADDHPVTQVSWNDAMAYAAWAGKRLPREVEWEFAARNRVNSAQKYSWGDDIMVNNRFMANVWQGNLQDPQGGDGYVYTSPVGAFGETVTGLTDMGGNVWQWCEDAYKPYGSPPASANPQVKVIRGGSFFFDEAVELSYTVFFRGSNSHETSLFNLGFRCAR